MERHALHAPAGANRRRKRVARGHGGPGHKTAGRGTKGQKARSHAGVPAWFEGGQDTILSGDCPTVADSAMPVFALLTNRSMSATSNESSRPVPPSLRKT